MLLFLLGLLVGILICGVYMFKTYLVGNLRVDNSDPEDGPYMFLELSKQVGEVTSKEYVILKVDNSSLLTHKKQAL